MLIGFNNNSFILLITKALIVILTCLWFGGIVLHYCFDGMEPDISLHFENLNGHVEHGEDSGHIDFERRALTDNLLPKYPELGVQLFSWFLLIIGLLKPALSQRYQANQPRIVLASHSLRPPLRAPPAHS